MSIRHATLSRCLPRRLRRPRALIAAALGILAGASALASTAHAGEISLFEAPGFGGRVVTLRANARSVSNVGFNDRASSIVVRAGRWEVCSDDDFRGDCAIFEAGQYPSLDGRFDKRVSSAREVDVVGATAPPPMAAAGNGSVDLFGQPNFRGRTVRIEQDVNTFNDIRFNDRVSSVIVQGGNWELCTDANFRGTCRTFVPGRYATLGDGMDRSISSARPIVLQPPSAVRGGGWEHARREDVHGGGDRDGRRDPADGGRGDVELFTGVNFSGDRYPIRHDLANFSDGGFNDRIGSVIVHAGQWQMCIDANFRGSCTVFGPGRYAALGGLTNQLSSIRRID